jgi:hypothetical protein
MQCIVYVFRQLSANTVHSDEVINAGTRDTLQTAELPEQLSAPLRAQSGNFLKSRSSPRFGALLAVPGDGKSMRFVANLLNQK